MLYPEHLPAILGFLDRIGIPASVGPVIDGSFLPGLRIAAGAITVDPDKCLSAGDVLHEAGHIAITPARYRATVADDVAVSLQPLLQAFGEAHPDALSPGADPVMKGMLQGSEQQAMAWSYAATVELGIPPETVFYPGSYGHPPGRVPASLIMQLQHGLFIGIDWLAMCGLTDRPRRFHDDPETGTAFPRMQRWLQA